MTTYFPQNNWEPFVYQRLNELIDTYQKPQGTPLDQQAYVVFDFDNTSAISDVEDNLMIYMLEHLLYKLSPQEFLLILTTGPFNFDLVLEEGRSNLTPRHLALDIIENYQWLYEHYILKQTMSLDDVKATDYYRDFQAKLRYYYKAVNKHFTRQAGQAWLTYWFQGYSQTEFIELCRRMLQHALDQPVERHAYTSSQERPGLAGQVESHFVSGLAFPRELRDLYQAFQTHQIATYVVSASPIDLVRTAVLEFGFNLPFDQIVAMCYSINGERQIIAQMEADSYITKQAGKTEAIMNLLAPLHGNAQPLALFGDSMGDYDMMTTLKDVKLNVLFNCLLDDGTSSLVELAQGLYRHSDAQFVVQGRNENTAQLRPSPKSIPLGSTNEQLLRSK